VSELTIDLPDVLVLAGGGVLGEAWMTGVLAGIEEAASVDFRDCELVVGTSAGSIVGANLVAGRAPRRPEEGESDSAEPAGPQSAEPEAGGALAAFRREALRWTGVAFSPAAAPLMSVTAPGGALARAAILARMPVGTGSLARLRRNIDGLGLRFDGRLRVAAVDTANGRRVVFGTPGAPTAKVGEAVQASCSVPTLFPPVRIGAKEYVDGGVWSPTNLDAAPAGLGTQVLCLHPTAAMASALQGRRRGFAAFWHSGTVLETQALRRKGATVRMVAPNRECADLMGADFMNPGPRKRVLLAGFRQGRSLAD
jgi:NTE family protein